MHILWGTIGSFVAIFSFAILIECPKKQILTAGITGAVGGGVYLISFYCLTDNTFYASFLSALAVAFLSQEFARIFKAPVTMFLIPGILPTVPGAGMYRIVYYMVRGDMNQCSYYLFVTLAIAGAMALAIFITNTVYALRRRWKQKRVC